METCPAWAPTGVKEIHISAGVALSVWQRWQASGDVEWLHEVALPILAEVADFWMSRALGDSAGATLATLPPAGSRPPASCDAVCSDGGWASYLCRWCGAAESKQQESNGGEAGWVRAGALHIADVIPPTEFYGSVVDSVYTNAAAVAALQFAAAAAARLAVPAAVAAPWREVAARLEVPFDSGRGLHPYFGGGGWEWDKHQVQLLDALMLWWPIGGEDGTPLGDRLRMNATVFVNDLAYYISHQEPSGSVAFSWALNALLYGAAGDAARLEAYTVRAYDAFVFGPFRVWMEGAGGWGCPNFVTGAGALAEVLLFGYARIRLTPTSLSLRPTVPAAAAALAVHGVAFHGRWLSFTVNATTVVITVTDTPHPDDPTSAAWWTPRSATGTATQHGTLPPWAAGDLVTDARAPHATVAAVFAARPWLADAARRRAAVATAAAAPHPPLLPPLEVEVSGRRTPLPYGVPVAVHLPDWHAWTPAGGVYSPNAGAPPLVSPATTEPITIWLPHD